MGNQLVLLCLSTAGRLSALERVRSERFHCNNEGGCASWLHSFFGGESSESLLQ